MDDVGARIRGGSHACHSQRGVDSAPAGPRQRMPLGSGVTFGKRLGGECFDHIPILAVCHYQHAVIAGDLHRLENAAIVDAQAAVVGREHLECGDAHFPQIRDPACNPFIEAGQVHVEGIIDGCLLRHLHPGIHGMLKALFLQYHKIHHGRGSAKGCGLMTAVMVI